MHYVHGKEFGVSEYKMSHKVYVPTFERAEKHFIYDPRGKELNSAKWVCMTIYARIIVPEEWIVEQLANVHHPTLLKAISKELEAVELERSANEKQDIFNASMARVQNIYSKVLGAKAAKFYHLFDPKFVLRAAFHASRQDLF